MQVMRAIEVAAARRASALSQRLSGFTSAVGSSSAHAGGEGEGDDSDGEYENVYTEEH